MDQTELLTRMVDSLPDGLIAFDLEGCIIYCNTAARELLRLTQDPAGKGSSALKREDIERFLSVARSGDSAYIELYEHGVQLNYSDMQRDGQRIGAVLHLTDVGEQQRNERLRQEFTANVSHELKTPLTSISGYAEMIAAGLVREEDIKGFARRIESEAKRMLTLISDIIRLSELDEFAHVQPTERFPLSGVVDECMAILQPAAAMRNQSLQSHCDDTEIVGVRSLICDLVYNLMDNAIRYNRDNGLVSVNVSGGKLTVRDTGIGIPVQHRGRIFERFYRVDKSRSKATGGTGLGLAIVKHICEQHHATIRLESKEGIGTEISVRFPSAEETGGIPQV